jgi:hypothetical protein
MGEVEELREKLAALEQWKKEKLVQLKKLTEGNYVHAISQHFPSFMIHP